MESAAGLVSLHQREAREIALAVVTSERGQTSPKLANLIVARYLNLKISEMALVYCT
jgi:hypothetical protein